MCYKFGTSQIAHDVWFSWTAPVTAVYTMDACIAVRLGSGADTPVGDVSTVTYKYATMVFTAGGQIPFPGLPGESWSFQRWNRDLTNPAFGCTGGPCVAGFSNAVTVCLAP